MGTSLSLLRQNIDTLLIRFRPSTILVGTTVVVMLFMRRPKIVSQLLTIRRWMNRHGFKRGLQFLIFAVLKHLPAVRSKVKMQHADTKKALQENVLKETASELRTLVLPKHGLPKDVLMSRLREWSNKEFGKWSGGQASGAVYHGGKELSKTLAEVYGMFSLSNPLHPDLFPYCRKMEAEVVQMLIALFHGDSSTACGTMSSGGTESILLACKAYRDRARALHGIEEPEIVAPVTIHAAFEKAAHYFGMTLVHVPIDPFTMRCRLSDVRAAVSSNTVLIAASAPCFPHGVIDPIAELSDFAESIGVGFHSDCCLGGLLAPFVEKLGYPLPQYDFRNSGVTSISADTHKYGYAPKGSSAILYSSEELRHYQYFCTPEWTGGIYASPTLAGSRPGALCACTWAALVSLGEEGYMSAADDIMKAALRISNGISMIDGIHVLGKPDLSVIAFASDNESILDTYKISEAMSKKGWNLNVLQYPSAIHICCTYLHRSVADNFVNDLQASVDAVRADPKAYADGMAAIYGMAQGVPDSSLIEPIAHSFIDALFMP